MSYPDSASNDAETLESPTVSFESLGVDPFLIARLQIQGITIPTPIQEQAIPPLFRREHALFSSPTGSGKTLAYLLPLVQAMLVPASQPQQGASWPELLICAPTFELCSQIFSVVETLLEDPGPFRPISRSLVIGSGNLSRQIDRLRREKPRIIVGNPGRLALLARMGKLKLRGVAFFVLDEGDRLVADELWGETQELASYLNPARITVSCSATLPTKSLERLRSIVGTNPAFSASLQGDLLQNAIEHWALFSESRNKIRTLRSFLAAVKPRKTLVFASRGGDAGNVLSQLQHHGIAAGGLWGSMEKQARKQSLDDFRAGRVAVLVTTDLAARGLDIPGISHIVALDVPQEPDPYIHRAGRTARAGKRGIMVTIGDGLEMERLAKLEKKLKIVIYPKVLEYGRLLPADERA